MMLSWDCLVLSDSNDESWNDCSYSCIFDHHHEKDASVQCRKIISVEDYSIFALRWNPAANVNFNEFGVCAVTLDQNNCLMIVFGKSNGSIRETQCSWRMLFRKRVRFMTFEEAVAEAQRFIERRIGITEEKDRLIQDAVAELRLRQEALQELRLIPNG